MYLLPSAEARVKQNAKFVCFANKWHDLGDSRRGWIGGGFVDDVDRLLASLEDRFDAELEADERLAAADLALSLLQDQTLRELAPRGTPLIAETEEGTFPVGWVGADFVADRRYQRFVRLDHVTLLESDEGALPDATAFGLLDVLRHMSRDAVRVVVGTKGRTTTGALERAGKDHVVVRSAAGRRIVPWSAVTSVSRAPEG